jgi:hypothetical protein
MALPRTSFRTELRWFLGTVLVCGLIAIWFLNWFLGEMAGC